MNDKLKNAIGILTEALKNDPEYKYTWQANIAVAQMDAEANYKKKTKKKYLNIKDKHTIANQGAINFLDILAQ